MHHVGLAESVQARGCERREAAAVPRQGGRMQVRGGGEKPGDRKQVQVSLGAGSYRGLRSDAFRDADYLHAF